MDPNTAHRIATDAAQRILDCEDQQASHREQDPHCTCNDCLTDAGYLAPALRAAVDEVTEDERGPGEFAVDLATAWQSLDQWITRGGFLPQPWQPSAGLLANRREQPAARPAGIQLEDLIDAHGLASVIRTIENVCHDKAEHIAHAWQDHTLARDWTKAAGLIARTAARLATLNPTIFGE